MLRNATCVLFRFPMLFRFNKYVDETNLQEHGESITCKRWFQIRIKIHGLNFFALISLQKKVKNLFCLFFFIVQIKQDRWIQARLFSFFLSHKITYYDRTRNFFFIRRFFFCSRLKISLFFSFPNSEISFPFRFAPFLRRKEKIVKEKKEGKRKKRNETKRRLISWKIIKITLHRRGWKDSNSVWD